MAIDPTDPGTRDLEDAIKAAAPKRRGRPPKRGAAMSGAERMREARRRAETEDIEIFHMLEMLLDVPAAAARSYRDHLRRVADAVERRNDPRLAEKIRSLL